MAIRNVVFDVGNVIVKWAPQDIAQLTFGEGEESALVIPPFLTAVKSRG